MNSSQEIKNYKYYEFWLGPEGFMYLLPVPPVLCEWKQYQVTVCGFWAPSDKYFSPDLILHNTETLKPLMNIKRISHFCPVSKALAEIARLAIETDLMQQLQTGESQDFTKHTVTAAFIALNYSLLFVYTVT